MLYRPNASVNSLTLTGYDHFIAALNKRQGATARQRKIAEGIKSIGECVYVIWFPKTGTMKIGWTRNLAQRLVHLKVPRREIDRLVLRYIFGSPRRYTTDASTSVRHPT